MCNICSQLFLINIYYKMFFLVTHILIGKYYPNLITQFIIGCSFYVISFLIIKDILTGCNYNQYKYYALALIVIDASFLIFKTKSKIDSQKPKEATEAFDFIKKTDNTTSDLKTGTIQSVSLSSEINDYRITHDLSLSDDVSSIFSNTEEKSVEKPIEKQDKEDKESSSVQTVTKDNNSNSATISYI